ncbi:putative RNA methyltransferase [Candidatus Formimonas warabiya]|uniref:rRNA (Guanine-N1)-methyltransferase n=1 Tax=Formimonas warabiya TaxID=1761012 RepID=A0A3G1KW11_FORW1|nr:methyltransferase domain-containing protein [Candidatus Formimonas warabiya]ATW26621.1 rRNA (guanine-N1)-methyltransferase [Candidatus Formimonas warabiya]
MSKNIDLLAAHEDLFRCPICAGKMKLMHEKSLICTNRHCFDLAKQGYVNLLSRAVQTKYGRRMFASRRLMCRRGFFDPLYTKISKLILNQAESRRETIKILDTGCGEGSLLAKIQEKITQSSEIDHLGVGLDISKEGIVMAAQEYADKIWCVGDLARAPFAGQQFHVLLNILAPANYAEFERMLSRDGQVIKVIPEKGYLQELRDVFYEQCDREPDSSGNTQALFKSRFKLLDMERVQYRVALDHTRMEPLVHMTPLAWGATEERLVKALQANLRDVTIDLTILLGKKD